jgi:hypothetical protein
MADYSAHAFLASPLKSHAIHSSPTKKAQNMKRDDRKQSDKGGMIVTHQYPTLGVSHCPADSEHCPSARLLIACRSRSSAVPRRSGSRRSSSGSMAACLEALQPPPLWRTTMLVAWHRLAPAGKPAIGAAKDQAEPAQLRCHRIGK